MHELTFLSIWTEVNTIELFAFFGLIFSCEVLSDQLLLVVGESTLINDLNDV